MRKPRMLYPGAIYHVGARTNRKEFLLSSPVTKEILITVIHQAAKKFLFTIDNFCIMENHFHIIIKPSDGENLSKIMQWILGVFAIRYNRKNSLTGHVWGDRFFSRIIETIEALAETFKYIDENPIKAGLVKRARDWIYGGLHHALNRITLILRERTEWSIQFRKTMKINC